MLLAGLKRYFKCFCTQKRRTRKDVLEERRRRAEQATQTSTEGSRPSSASSVSSKDKDRDKDSKKSKKKKGKKKGSSKKSKKKKGKGKGVEGSESERDDQDEDRDEDEQQSAEEVALVHRGVTLLQAHLRRQLALRRMAERRRVAKEEADQYWLRVYEKILDEKRRRLARELARKQVIPALFLTHKQ